MKQELNFKFMLRFIYLWVDLSKFEITVKDEQIAKLTDTIKAQAQSINADRHNELAGTLQMQLTDGEIDKPMNRWKRVWMAWKGE